jgi:hypothetical protein
MNGIQNKNGISRKKLSFTCPVYVIGKENSESFLSCPAYAHAPPHFCHHVRNLLEREMAGRWIGKDGQIACPPRSPYFTTLYFFLWGYVKNIVYLVKIKDLQHLKARIKGHCDYGNIKQTSSNVERGRVSSGYLSCHQGSPH